jgi:hypothetical protein
LQESIDWEAFYIKEFDCVYPRGFNLLPGDWSLFPQQTLEIREKVGKALQGKNYRSDSANKYIGVKKIDSGFACRVLISQSPKIRKSKNYKDEIEAAEAYDKIVLKVYGVEANLNFPEKREKYLKDDLNSFYENFLEPNITKRSKYKWVSIQKGGKFVVFLIDKKKRIPKLKLGSFDQEEEAAQLADKIAWFYLGTPIDELNFPEKAADYDRENLYTFFEGLKYTKYSQYKGVSYLPKKERWIAYICDKGKTISLGTFPTEEEAYEATLAR